MTYSIVLDLSGAARADVARRDADGAIVPIGVDTADSRALAEWLTAGNVPTTPPEPSLNARKAAALAALADRRWRAETAGVTLAGLRFATDRGSVLMLGAVAGLAKMDAAYAVSTWKLADGNFVTLSNAEVLAAAAGVTAHVQSCFDREAQLAAQITAAADATALAAIDVETGWPG